MGTLPPPTCQNGFLVSNGVLERQVVGGVDGVVDGPGGKAFAARALQFHHGITGHAVCTMRCATHNEVAQTTNQRRQQCNAHV